MQGEYAVYTRAKDGTLTGRINDFVGLHIIMTLNDPGSWNMTSLSQDECPFHPGDGIIVVRNGVFLYGGVMTELSDDLDATTGLHSWQVQGKGDLEYLNRRICYVDPATGRTDQVGHYTASDYMSVVVQNLIKLNLGQSAMTARKEPIIEDNAQGNLGPSISVSLRFQKLLKVVTAIVSGNGWNIQARWDEANNKVYYEVYQGRDLTDNIVFTEQLSNITAAEHLANAPDGNFILAGGTGEMTARQFDTAQDNTSISEWGRIEYFQDARNQNNLSGYADEVLANKTADSVGYGCTASNAEQTPQYGTDYVLGDYVAMKIFGQYITAEVQQVEISVEEGIETVEPRFGTVAIGKLKSIFRQLSNLRSDVDELLGTEVE